jgi:uncharacterized protein
MVESLPSDVERIRAILAEHLPELRRDYAVDSLSLFGSYVRGEQGPNSDLDVLVTFSATPGLLDFVGLKLHLVDLLGMNVDLVMKSALKPHIGQRILEEAVSV